MFNLGPKRMTEICQIPGRALACQKLSMHFSFYISYRPSKFDNLKALPKSKYGMT